MAKKKKFYVVWKGKKPGIYGSWGKCKTVIEGYKGAKYKSFRSYSEAETAFDQGAEEYFSGQNRVKKSNTQTFLDSQPDFHSISVDAASSGNPGKMEYRGVDTKTKKQLFAVGPFPQGTNNIGEFLAIVHGLAFLKKHESDRFIYTDSKIAMGWVQKKHCKTTLQKNSKTKKLFEYIKRAEKWLKTNDYSTPVVKWKTKSWGEIPADFGRK